MQIEENAMKNHCTEKNIEEIRSNAQFLVDLLPGEKNINKKISGIAPIKKNIFIKNITILTKASNIEYLCLVLVLLMPCTSFACALSLFSFAL